MSCYNWEAGTIQLPKAQFAKIKKQFVNDYNKLLERQMEAAERLRQHVLTINKGKRNVKWWCEVSDHADKFGVSWATVGKMTRGERNKKPNKLTKKAMDFANSKTTSFSVDGEGYITFNPQEKTVTYSVDENNRAVEHARESNVGKLFFRTMNSINWTRGSGGSLYGNDEYNRHESYGGSGGGNYTTATWPAPKVDKPRYAW